LKINRRKPPDSRVERQIVTGMIVSKKYLKEVLPILKSDSLLLPYAKTIAQWCREYFEQYETSPGKHIQDLFLAHKKTIQDEDQIKLIEEFLSGLSSEYEQSETFNVQYILDKTELHFRKNALDSLRQELGKCIAGERVEDGEALIAGYSRISRQETVGVDPISDENVIRKAFDPDSGDKMFQLPGDLGNLLGRFEREMFVMIVGAMGKGKSWWLQEIALRGLFAGFNVLFVSLEMSEGQITRRIQHNLSGLPKGRWAGKVDMPVFDCEAEDCKDRVARGPCTKCQYRKEYQPTAIYTQEDKKELTGSKAVAKGKAVLRTFMKGRKLKLIAPPPGSINVRQLKTMLDNWEYYDGWVPDIIVTDYVDKFAAEDSSVREYRHRLYETVIAHKALASERKCLVVSGSQSNTGRDDSKKIKAGDFAEDIRKKAEVDIAFSLNQIAAQKEKGIMIISPMKIRDDDFSVNAECIVLQQLKIGKPYLDSYLK